MAREEQTWDPNTTMDILIEGLGRVDRFYYLARRRRLGREPDPPSATVEKVGPVMQIRGEGYDADVAPENLNSNAWDNAQKRYYALDRVITFTIDYYNALLAHLRTMPVSGDEMTYEDAVNRQHIEQRVEDVEKQLCSDFREMVSLDTQVLQVPLPDHYWLEKVCG
jgi:hypothetical protein